ncbi:MAG: arylsulfatase, partial [Planctomycetaceae bacterium]
TSDNGPWLAKKLDGVSAGALFEGKGRTWEGGFRVPAFLELPVKIRHGVTTTAFGTTMDLFTTLIKLGGGTVPADRPIDGQDLAPVLLQNHSGREARMFYYFGTELWAVRQGPWKLHFKTTNPSTVQVWGAWEVEVHDPPLLFNVESDPSEQHNVATSNSGIVRQLTALAELHRQQTQPGVPQR